MTDEPKRDAEGAPDNLPEEEESAAIASLLKRSLSAESGPAGGAHVAKDDAQKDQELLASVQRKLRARSKGKFYGDGWSTSRSRLNYALIAGVMLVTIVAVYLALGPMGVSLK